MTEIHDEGCCEHKNCYITFDMSSKDPDLFTYFIMHKEDGQEETEEITEYPQESWEQAAEDDTIYVFCRIHSDALLDHFHKIDGNISLNYLESIVKDPHFGDEDEE